ASPESVGWVSSTGTAFVTGPALASPCSLDGPPALMAVSNTLILWPTSAASSVYSCLLAALAMTVHGGAPEPSQRSHFSSKLVGLLDHLPWVSLSVTPWRASPDSVGWVSSTGTGGSTGPALASPCSLDGPPAFMAVSNTLILWPTSAASSVYSCLLAALAMTVHGGAPEPSQRSHFSSKLVGLLDHLPWVSLSVTPWRASPDSVGWVSSTGTAAPSATTSPVGADGPGVPEPPLLVAVSCTRIVCTTSAASRVYSCLLAALEITV